jgi:hypothetical protein
MPIKVFMAHASEDKAIIRRLHSKLVSVGIKPWLDEVDLKPAVEWRQVIKTEVRTCDLFLACLTKNSAKGGFLAEEFKLALDSYYRSRRGTVYLIPVKLSKCEVPDVSVKRGSLKDFQWLDCWQRNGFDKLFDTIKTNVKHTGFDSWLRYTGYRLQTATYTEPGIWPHLCKKYTDTTFRDPWRALMIAEPSRSSYHGFAGRGKDLAGAIDDVIAQVEGKELTYQTNSWDDVRTYNSVPQRLLRGAVSNYADLVVERVVE